MTFDAPGSQSIGPFTAEGRYELTFTDAANPSCSVSFPIDAYCPAANQTCETAAPLTINPAGSCTDLTEFNNWYASNGEYPITPQCSRFSGGDLFYRFSAPDEAIRLRFDEVPYSPICAVINEADCTNGGVQVASGSLREPGTMVLSGLTPGTRYTLRIYDGFDDNFGKVQFCAQAFEPLPIELATFAGERIGKDNMLSWRTLTEVGASHFEVLTLRGEEWVHIGEVPAASSNGGAYTFTHPSVVGDHSYRLRLFDLDGTSSFSAIVHVTRSNGDGVDIYPNPTHGLFTLRLPGDVERADVTISDLSGRLIQRSTAVDGARIDLVNAPRGVLLVSVKAGGHSYISRVCKL